jgi:hypothetical protein
LSTKVVMVKSVYKYCLIFAALFLVSSHAHSQVWIRGFLRDKLTNQAIIHGEVKSAFSSSFTDTNGLFKIRVTEGDIISAKAVGYLFDTVHFSFQMRDSALIIRMEPLGSMMSPITIKTFYSPYQLDSLKRRMAFDEGRSKTTLISREPHQGFGIIINLDRVTNSRDKGSKKQQQLFEKTEQWIYIRQRFPDSLVQHFTGLKGDTLRRFINRYTPSYEWLRTHPSKMDVILYINDMLILFRKQNQ